MARQPLQSIQVPRLLLVATRCRVGRVMQDGVFYDYGAAAAPLTVRIVPPIAVKQAKQLFVSSAKSTAAGRFTLSFAHQSASPITKGINVAACGVCPVNVTAVAG